MGTGNEYFSNSGPTHLSIIDWHNSNHRRSVAASLVEGVYILEGDRQAQRRGSNKSLAPCWWEFFHFKLIKQLVDDDDNSIFGAIFEYDKHRASSYHYSIEQSPCYVIAFRGTLIQLKTFIRDIELDIKIIRNGLHNTTRFGIAMKAVGEFVASKGDSHVWLAGHSLGAAIAMLAGKNMAKINNFLEAYIFNPPYLSAPIERIKNKKVKNGLRFAGTVVKAALAFVDAATSDKNNNSKSLNRESFAAISGWIPCLFVNPSDPICAEYIGYFGHRKKLQDMGAGAIARVVAPISLGHQAMAVAGVKGVQNSEPLHGLPSANLTVNLNTSQDSLSAHGLCQWWRSDLNLRSTVYTYK